MHTLLLSTCGRVWSCGIGKHGALGHGDTHGTANCPSPVQIVGGGLRQARAERARLGKELASVRADLDALKTSSSTRVAELEAEVEHLTEQLDTESFSHNELQSSEFWG